MEEKMEEKKYTIKEIKRYISRQDSLGDVLYYLNEENMDKAQEIIKIYDERTSQLILTIDLDYIDDDIIKSVVINWMDEEGKSISDSENKELDELLDELGLYINGFEL